MNTDPDDNLKALERIAGFHPVLLLITAIVIVAGIIALIFRLY